MPKETKWKEKFDKKFNIHSGRCSCLFDITTGKQVTEDISCPQTILKVFIEKTLQEEMEKKIKQVEELRIRSKAKPYDGNDLQSASDYYGIAANNWSEIIRFEDGNDSAIYDVLSILKTPTNN